MGKLIDLTGQKFGRLTVLNRSYTKNKVIYWDCQCDCGTQITVRGDSLRKGNTKSCGCLRKELQTKRQTIDLTGQQFGELTVLRQATKTEILDNTTVGQDETHAFWWVQCNCGAPPFVVLGKSLRSGSTKSCGHLRYENGKRKINNLIGQKFGRLTVIEFNKIEHHNAIWHCKCECGNEKDVAGKLLTQGKVKSCGCLHQELLGIGHPKDISNQQFGFIQPLYITDKRTNNGNAIWHCQCLVCGSEKDISAGTLIRGHAISCGCLKSKGESKIKEILINNNIKFEQEKIFDTCISSSTNKKLRFDFFINNQYLLEYDGEQHFIMRGWNTKDNLINTQYRDNIKNQWCKENNIPLIRIPYTHLNDLCIEDLLLETSNFLV